MGSFIKIYLQSHQKIVNPRVVPKPSLDVDRNVSQPSCEFKIGPQCVHVWLTYIHTFFDWLVPQRGFSESELHYIKNPNWWEAADQLAIYKRGRGDETRD